MLNDLGTCWVRELNRRYHKNVVPEEVREFDLRKSFPDLTELQIFLPYIDGTLYTDIRPVRPAQKLIRDLTEEGHRIYVATANILGICPETLREFYSQGWNARAAQYCMQFLWEFYPEIPPDHIIITPYKHLLRADALVDDNPDCLRRGHFRRILLDKPYNRDFDDGYFTVHRAKNWDDVARFLRETATETQERGNDDCLLTAKT